MYVYIYEKKKEYFIANANLTKLTSILRYYFGLIKKNKDENDIWFSYNFVSICTYVYL